MKYQKMTKNEWIYLARVLHYEYVNKSITGRDHMCLMVKNLIYTVNTEVNFDDMENDVQSAGSDGQPDTHQTNLNDFKGNGEF